jgi:UDP-N-acetylmuramoyl-L-alanyl-D-glutamate--2,6-diaminopimelate ligase
VVEVSSHALAEYRTAGIAFDAAVLTNVRRDHLDLHQSVTNYRRVKGRLLSQLSPEGFAVINADDPASGSYLRQLNNPVLTVGQHRPAELTATIIERHRSEQTFLLEAGQDTVPVRTQMIGDHHVTNCLLAAAVGLIYGVDLATVVRGLERVERVSGRLERIECGQPFGVFVDYARTPDTLATALRSLRRVTPGRVICVFGAEGGRETDQRPMLGRVVERAADIGIITNNNPGHEQPLAIAHDILDGYERPARAHILPDREKAISWALSQAETGDSVLVAGKGDECVQRLGEELCYFDDRELVRTWLYDRAAEETAHLRC